MSTDNVTGIKIFGVEQNTFENYIFIFFIFIGFILLSVGTWKKNKLTQSFGIGFFIVALLFMFIRSIEFRDVLVALASIIAVAFSAFSIYQSENIRKDISDKDKKDRKERLLSEIIEWATEAAKSAIYRQTKERHELWKAILDYKYCIAKSEYINVIAAHSFCTLTSLINCVVKKIDDVMNGTTKYRDSNTDENHELMLQCENKLTESAKELFREAAKIKSELLK